jgi:hypothetical protein
VTHFSWRPQQLCDPTDEFVLEAAVNGQAAAIVTFNRRDFGVMPVRFGIDVLSVAPGPILSPFDRLMRCKGGDSRRWTIRRVSRSCGSAVRHHDPADKLMPRPPRAASLQACGRLAYSLRGTTWACRARMAAMNFCRITSNSA